MKREDIKIGGLYLCQRACISNEGQEIETLFPVKVTRIDYDADEECDCINYESDALCGFTSPEWLYDKYEI